MSEWGEEILASALAYVRRNWAVFPLHSIDDNGCCTCGDSRCRDAGKHPRVRRGFKDATRDEAKILEWFGKGAPLSNIGVVTGEISEITVLDIDISDGKRGSETWIELTKEQGDPETLMARTGSGGVHMLFKYNSAIKTSTDTLGSGIDCRNDGGYIVAPPSRHRSGEGYRWVNEKPLASLPSHLLKRKEGRGRPRKDDPTRQKYTLGQVRSMLECVDPSNRDTWRHVGIILGREFDRSDEAFEIYIDWAGRWAGKKGRGHDKIMREAFYEISQQQAERELSIATVVRAAIEGGWTPRRGEVPRENFVYYGPGNNFIYRPTGSFWVAEAVNAAVSPINDHGKLLKPSDWLRANALATSMTKDPALEGDYVRGYDCREGILLQHEGAAVFNAYRGPTIELGDARLAQPFVDHVHRVFSRPGDADQFLDYMAHRAQRPYEKPRFALLIAGDQGVGKDTAVDFCMPAIGAWNVANIEPGDLDSGFNEYAAAVLVRISEAANLHDMSKWAFNERTKVLIAGVPDNIQVNPKYGQKYSVRLHCGVIVTTNHMTTGIYIPQDDRRYDVIECSTKREMELDAVGTADQYFSGLWAWFFEGGNRHVAAYLRERNIERFSAANGQRKTEAHRAIVAVSLANDHWLHDVLDKLGNPPAVRADSIMSMVERDGGNRKEFVPKLHAAMTRAGYRHFRSPDKDGRWKYPERRTTVFAKVELSLAEAARLQPGLTVPF